MTKDEALKLALEALEQHGCPWLRHEKPYNEAITAIKEALAQPEQEPVALEDVYLTIIQWDVGGGKRSRRELARRIVAKYTTPPQRTWQGLTDEEIWDEVKAADLDWHTGWSLDEDASNRYITFARAIEAAHGITGEQHG